jgi:hypothetical protein
VLRLHGRVEIDAVDELEEMRAQPRRELSVRRERVDGPLLLRADVAVEQLHDDRVSLALHD